MKLPDSIYNIIKWVCLTVSPALCTLIVALSSLWGWDIPTEAIVGTISAVTLFLGAVLGFSTVAYNKEKEEDMYIRR